MKTRKFAASLLAAILAVGIAGTALAAPTVPGAVYSDQQAQGANKPVEQIQQDLQSAGIKDVKPTDYFAGSMTVVIQAGLLKPDAQGNIDPKASVKADEGVAVFAKVLGIASKTDDAATAAQKMADAGLVKKDTVAADHDMTRVEVARMLATALGVQPDPMVTRQSYPFNDFNSTSAEDLGILKALYDLGIFKGFPDRTFRPDEVLTKAQIAILVDRILGASGH